MTEQLVLPATEDLTAFCRAHNILGLSLFGSALRDDFNSSSDIDLLVRFRPSAEIGYIGIARLARALSPLFGGRKVDLRTPNSLNPRFRDTVVKEARLLVDISGDRAATRSPQTTHDAIPP